MRIAFIGLGIMGLPMAIRLVSAGHDVVGHTRSPGKAVTFADAGGRLVGSVREAVAEAEVVITMLPDSPDVEQVYTTTDGVLAAVRPGAVLVDMSTISPDVAVRLGQAAAAVDCPMLDAPVSGGESGAREGVLSIMVGGEAAILAQIRPILEVLGTTIVHVGAAGAGQTVKAANQLMVAGIIELVSEALVFLDARKVELGAAVEVLNGGLAGSTVLGRKAEAMIEGNFVPGFRVELHHKDLSIYHEAARAAGVFSPLGAAVAELMGSLRATGGAQLDHGALLRQVDMLSGGTRWQA